MTKPLHPALKKGHRFSIDWPPGYVPQPYTPPYQMSEKQAQNLRKGTKATNSVTGRKFYSKSKASHLGPTASRKSKKIGA